ncbi:nuclear transport factor 2 family protein [Euzebya sp.]|uniref:nuclear transport factor 2 family protein n=1 Tax=Euzebya sp. TaxID=1971409 RepID=UPI0035192D9D
MEHPNATALRRLYDAAAAGDVDGIVAGMTPDVVWHVPGRSTNSGTYKGPEEVLGFLGTAAERTGGTLSLTVHRVFADDEWGVVLTTYTATREGAQLENNLAHVVRMVDGRIAESWYHSRNQYEVDDFWGRP